MGRSNARGGKVDQKRFELDWDGFRKPRFEARELASLLDVAPRRIEGWVERALLRPGKRGHGPGRRRLFSIANALEGLLLLELQKALGKKHPDLKHLIAYEEPVLRRVTAPGGATRTVLKGPLALVAYKAAELLGKPGDSPSPKDSVVAVGTFGERRYEVLIGEGWPENKGLREELGEPANEELVGTAGLPWDPLEPIKDRLREMVKEGASVMIFSLSRIVNDLRDRLQSIGAWRDDRDEE
jgi:DNA-binding transcriptional MerR regulator